MKKEKTSKNVTGLWKWESNNGLKYFKSPKLDKETVEALIEMLNKPNPYFLVYNNSFKEDGDKRPNINLVVDNAIDKIKE